MKKEEMIEKIKALQEEDYKNFFKALLYIERRIEEIEAEKLYEAFMDSDYDLLSFGEHIDRIKRDKEVSF